MKRKLKLRTVRLVEAPKTGNSYKLDIRFEFLDENLISDTNPAGVYEQGNFQISVSGTVLEIWKVNNRR